VKRAFISTANMDILMCTNCGTWRTNGRSSELSSQQLRYKSSFPRTSPLTDSNPPNEESAKADIIIDASLITHLERTSLVDFEDEAALRQLKEAIDFASSLQEINTDGVAPMTSPLDPLEYAQFVKPNARYPN